MQDLVSIIVPAYNVDKYIGKCIRSIMHQSYDNIEIIIVDDGSTDETSSICEELSSSDKRVRLIKQKNLGVSAARNRGLNECTGNWILFVDSDDWIELSMISDIYSLAQTTDSEIIVSSYSKNEDDEEPIILQQLDYTSNCFGSDNIWLLGACILSPTEWNKLFPPCQQINLCSPFAKLYKREIIQKYSIRFNEKITLAEDQDFNLKYMNHIDKLCYYEKPLYHYRIRAGSVSRNINKVIEKYIASNTVLLETIREIGISSRITNYWNAHLAENALIIARMLFKDAKSYKELYRQAEEYKEYLVKTSTHEAIKQIPIENVDGRKKRIAILLIRLRLIRLLCLLYRVMR